jgi:hypothetical protein
LVVVLENGSVDYVGYDCGVMLDITRVFLACYELPSAMLCNFFKRGHVLSLLMVSNSALMHPPHCHKKCAGGEAG